MNARYTCLISLVTVAFGSYALAEPPKSMCGLENATYTAAAMDGDSGFKKGGKYDLKLTEIDDETGWTLTGTNVKISGEFYKGAGRCGEKILFGHGIIGDHEHQLIATGHWRAFDGWKRLSIQVISHVDNHAAKSIEKLGLTHNGQVHLDK